MTTENLAGKAKSAQMGGARAQAIALLVVGALCAIVAYLFHPGKEIGLLVIGLGLLGVSLLNPAHHLIPGLIITPFALGNVLWQYGILSLGQVEAAHLLGLGVALGLVALLARRGTLGAHPYSPAALVALVGLLLLGLTTPGLSVGSFYGVLVSLWAPATLFVALGVLGFVRR